MKVTSVRLDNVAPKDKGICAEATITLDDSFQVHNVMVIRGNKGLFVAFPNIGVANGRKKRFIDVAHPVNENLRQHIVDEVLKAYHEN